MNAIHPDFGVLELSEYQPVVHLVHQKCNTYMKRVFNRKRNHIDASNAVGVFNVTSVLEEFERNALLMSINLSQNQLRENDVKRIAKGITVSASLTSIDLGDNWLCSDGAKHIAEGIAVSASLTSIYLPLNEISGEGVKNISEAVSVSTSLTSIDLSANEILDLKALNTSPRESLSTPR